MTEPSLRARQRPMPAPHLFRSPSEWALFLDVDGTLLDLAAAPDRVRVDAQLRSDLDTLWQRLDGAVALISGRPLQQLDALFGWSGRAAAGVHGAQLRCQGGPVRAQPVSEHLAELYILAQALAAPWAGLRVEQKDHALALHFRNARVPEHQLQRIALQLLDAAGAEYAIQPGNQVLELKPRNASKGHALRALMRSPQFTARRPWVAGDDLTDEDAFRAANALGGASVVVGARRPTAATRQLPDPAAMRKWLHLLACRETS